MPILTLFQEPLTAQVSNHTINLLPPNSPTSPLSHDPRIPNTSKKIITLIFILRIKNHNTVSHIIFLPAHHLMYLFSLLIPTVVFPTNCDNHPLHLQNKLAYFVPLRLFSSV